MAGDDMGSERHAVALVATEASQLHRRRPFAVCRGRECGNQQLSHDVIGSSLLQVVHAVRLAVDRAAPALVCLEHQASMSAERAWQVTIWARSDMQSLW